MHLVYARTRPFEATSLRRDREWGVFYATRPGEPEGHTSKPTRTDTADALITK